MSFPLSVFPLFHSGPEACALGDELRLRLLYLGGVTLTEAWRFTDLARPYWRFYCNLDAGATMRAGGRDRSLLPGRVYAIPAWMPWSCACAGRVRHVVAHVEIPAFTRASTRALGDDPIELPASGAEGELARELVALASALARQDAPTLAQQCAGYALAYRLVAAATARIEEPARERLWTPRGGGALAEVLAYIARNLDARIPAARLARIARCSPAQLTRLFRRHLRSSPAGFVRERRVARAAELLTTTDDSVERIAEATGFPNRNYFTRVFTRHLGVGPGRYRRPR